MRRMERCAAIFSVLTGGALLSTWIVMFAVGKVPEISTKPLETSLLLTAELLTAFALIGGGFGVLARRQWGVWTNLVAMGMLLYCVINYIGILAEQGSWPVVAWFAFVAMLTIIFVGDYLRQSRGQ